VAVPRGDASDNARLLLARPQAGEHSGSEFRFNSIEAVLPLQKRQIDELRAKGVAGDPQGLDRYLGNLGGEDAATDEPDGRSLFPHPMQQVEHPRLIEECAADHETYVLVRAELVHRIVVRACRHQADIAPHRSLNEGERW